MIAFIRRLVLALALLLAPLPALAATYQATPASLAQVTAKARTEADVHIQLLAGDYGDYLVKYAPVQVSGGRDAVFRSISLQSGASGSSFDGFTCAQLAPASGVATPACIKVAGSAALPVNNVTISNIKFTCPNATWGTDPNLPLPPRWAGGNVIGWPSGGAVSAAWFDGLTVQKSEVSNCDKGLGFTSGSNLRILGNDIHDIRTSAIVGATLKTVLIQGNWLHEFHPFKWGEPAGNGDHADAIHIWTEANKTPVDSLVISANLIEQGSGVAILGPYMDDNNHGRGFTNFAARNNVILLGNNQGMRFENVHGVATGNVLLQPPGNVGDKAPQIVICDPAKAACAASDIALNDNFTAPGIQPPIALLLAKRLVGR